MKKAKTIIKEVPFEIYQSVSINPFRIFSFVEELSLKIPIWSSFAILKLYIKAHKLDLTTYEDFNDLLEDYSKCVLKQSNSYEIFTFQCYDEGDWQLFNAPPVVSPEIDTRLKPYLE